jgi:hypothetical protein
LELITVARDWLAINEQLSVAPGLLTRAAVDVALVVALLNSRNEVSDHLHAVTFLELVRAVWQVEVLFSLLAVFEIEGVFTDDNLDRALFRVFVAGVESDVVLAAADIVNVLFEVSLAVTVLLDIDTLASHHGSEGIAVHFVHLVLAGSAEVNEALIFKFAVIEAHVHLAVRHEGLGRAVDLLANVAVIVFHINVETVHEILALHTLLAVSAGEIDEASALHLAWLEAGGNLADLHTHIFRAIVVGLAFPSAGAVISILVLELLAVHAVELTVVHELNNARFVAVALANLFALGVLAEFKARFFHAVDGLHAVAFTSWVHVGHSLKEGLELSASVGVLLTFGGSPVNIAALNVIAGFVAEGVHALGHETVLVGAIVRSVAEAHL